MEILISELRAQVETFGKGLVKFPPLIMSHVYKQSLSALKKSQETSRRHFTTMYESLERKKVSVMARPLASSLRNGCI